MNIQEEIYYSEMLINEARKVNPTIGHFIELIGKPLSGDITVRLTNGNIKISGLIMAEFRRSRKRTPKSFIEEVASTFDLKILQ